MSSRSRLPLVLLLGMTACSNGQNGPTPPDTTGAQAFLDTLQRRTFDFFWERTNPANGLTPDRWPTNSFSSIAAVGFALTAYGIGVDQGYVTRAAAADRVLTTLQFFWTAPQGSAATGTTGYQGFFYHFLDMNSGSRFQTVELSSIDTALLLGGILFCREYFDGTSSTEQQIRSLADSIYRRVNWRFLLARAPLISMGWTPENGLHTYDWKGYDEAMLVYILALGSPTFAADSGAFEAWTATYQWGTYYGQQHVGFAPLFGHQYSHVWVDFRGIHDAYLAAHGIDYFENSRRATLAQQAYGAANPMAWTGYDQWVWGLSASDGPADMTQTVNGQPRQFMTYAARGADFTEVRDDGTIAPTAAGGSIPFAPEIAVPALLAMRQRYGANVFGQYGFVDAFNPTFRWTASQGHVVPNVGWFDTDYLGIDQGPIIAGIANWRTELVWKTMRKSPYVIRGLRRAGFSGGWLDQAP